ncbi:YgcG family protein [Nitratireductor sp. ZSWI3]|uniref:TPM domain-containing protein n=1 Tax=Nitratireductor sp. ZSWI3 TaxID=2966359 RepID=UPI0021502E94|nr:YgcG family protein [Nitratireductor sp. ZSWI3]MCR4265635.1 YgcG family protein [Nitratireductor sp. ZSWI3]
MGEALSRVSTGPERVGRLAGRLRAMLAICLAVLAASLFAPSLFATSLFAAEIPPLTGRVVDNAGIIDDAAERALTEKLAAFEARSSDQIVVATIRSLEGEALEPFANRLFRAWGIGQAGENNGILLLVALDDRKMRIEVGYGLEGTLTDLHSKLIIENTMVPAFRAGDFSGGISRAVDDMIMVLEGNAAELEARAERNRQQEESIPWPVLLFMLVWGTFFFGGFAFAFLPPIFGRKIGPGRYRWLGMDVSYNKSGRRSSSGRSSGGWSSGGGGFSGGGGSSGGGGASGSW